jgi:hypothetical protein
MSIKDEFGESRSAPDCIYCGGKIGFTCLDPQGCQEKAWKRDNEREGELGTMEKLRRCQQGVIQRFTRDEMRILKTLDRANEIRSRPVPVLGPVDGVEWEAWFEWQTVHADDLAQVTGRFPI